MNEFISQYLVSGSQGAAIIGSNNPSSSDGIRGGYDFAGLGLGLCALVGASLTSFRLGEIYLDEILNFIWWGICSIVEIPITITLETFKAIANYVAELLSGLIPGLDDVTGFVGDALSAINPFD